MTAVGGTTKAPTFTAGAPVNARRLVPVTSMSVVVLPPTALDGVKPVILGTTLKIVVLGPTPAGVVTLITPVRAPGGTVAVTVVAVTAVGGTVTGPLNVTLVAPSRLIPATTTDAPTGAAAGATEVMRGTVTTVSVTVASLVSPWPSLSAILSAQVCEAPVRLKGGVHVVAGWLASAKVPAVSPPVQVDVHPKVTV